MAVQQADVLAAGAEFDVAGAQVAGDERSVADGGGAWEIMTGARMPEGLDSVVPVERIEVLARNGEGRPARIRLAAEVRPGDNVRLRGQDVESGTTVLRAGTVVDSAAVMVLSSLGVDRVAVRRRRTPGGAGPEPVAAQREAFRARIEADRVRAAPR